MKVTFRCFTSGGEMLAETQVDIPAGQGYCPGSNLFAKIREKGDGRYVFTATTDTGENFRLERNVKTGKKEKQSSETIELPNFNPDDHIVKKDIELTEGMHFSSGLRWAGSSDSDVDFFAFSRVEDKNNNGIYEYQNEFIGINQDFVKDGVLLKGIFYNAYSKELLNGDVKVNVKIYYPNKSILGDVEGTINNGNGFFIALPTTETKACGDYRCDLYLNDKLIKSLEVRIR